MRKLLACVLIVAALSGCVKRKTTHDLVPPSSRIDQTMLDAAWKDALRIGGAKKDFPLSVPLARVVFVPSSMVMGPWQFYGITVTEPMIIDGKLQLVETIEIHLPENLSCHMGQVLRHELLHTVATRRALTDSSFRKEIEEAEGEEQWVRKVYPIEMTLCE